MATNSGAYRPAALAAPDVAMQTLRATETGDETIAAYSSYMNSASAPPPSF